MSMNLAIATVANSGIRQSTKIIGNVKRLSGFASRTDQFDALYAFE